MPRSPNLRPLTVYGTPEELELIRRLSKAARMSASSWVMATVLTRAKDLFETQERRRLTVDEFIARALNKV